MIHQLVMIDSWEAGSYVARQPGATFRARTVPAARSLVLVPATETHARAGDRAGGGARALGPAPPPTNPFFFLSLVRCLWHRAHLDGPRSPVPPRGLRVPGRGVARDRGGRRYVVPRCALLCAARAARGAWRGRAARGAGLCLLAECPSQQTWGTPACVRAGRAHATNAATHGAGARQVHASRGRGGPRAASRAWRGLAEEGRSRPPDDQAKGRLLP